MIEDAEDEDDLMIYYGKDELASVKKQQSSNSFQEILLQKRILGANSQSLTRIKISDYTSVPPLRTPSDWWLRDYADGIPGLKSGSLNLTPNANMSGNNSRRVTSGKRNADTQQGIE